MLSIILFLVGITAAETPNNFVAVEWSTYSDGTVYLVPQELQSAQTPLAAERMPAGQDLPQYTPPYQEDPSYPVRPKPAVPPPAYKPPYHGKYKGLGKYSCIKKGFLDAGEGDVSNKQIAMIAVRAKDKYDGMYTAESAERASMREAVYTLSAIGPCKGGSYRFTSSEAARSEQWLNARKINVSKAEYASIFQMERNRVDAVVTNYDSTPGRVQRNWEYWNSGTAAHTCTKPLPAKKRIRLCQMISRACRITEVGCGRGHIENPRGNEGGNDNGGNNNGGNDNGGNNGGTSGGDNNGGTSGGDNNGGSDNGGNNGGTTGNGETGPGSNDGSGHGNDNGGGHGAGPGG